MPFFVGPGSSPEGGLEMKSDRVGIPTATSDPASAVLGDVYMHTVGAGATMKLYNGSEFIAVGGDADSPISVSYLVIAGGGGGGRGRGGGGGAGGYRTNYASETPGGPGTSTEAAFTIELSTNYPVQIGAGGVAGPGMDKRGFQGGPSIFSTITSVGGAGGGAAYQPISRDTEGATYEGGSGGGGAGQVNTPATDKGHGSSAVSPSSSPPHVVQGHNGGDATPDTGNDGTGGGGAGAAGQDGQGGDGGAGKASSITGSSVTRGGGGGGGGDDASGNGGSGGGGNGSTGASDPGTHATGGGGGGSKFNHAAGRGGTGIVILRYPNAYTIANPGGGLTLSTSTTGSDRVTQITHPSPTAVVPDGNATGNISWS